VAAGFLSGFSPDVRTLAASVVAASVELYNRISLELLPTPAKIHYMFNMRDLTKLMQVSDSFSSLLS
jgi:dynein heavy chain